MSKAMVEEGYHTTALSNCIIRGPTTLRTGPVNSNRVQRLCDFVPAVSREGAAPSQCRMDGTTCPTQKGSAIQSACSSIGLRIVSALHHTALYSTQNIYSHGNALHKQEECMGTSRTIVTWWCAAP